jgi:hypothetical protein
LSLLGAQMPVLTGLDAPDPPDSKGGTALLSRLD